jgi:hypothetical protein
MVPMRSPAFLDAGEVVVDLGCAADAGGPKFGIACDGFGEWAFGDDVGEGEPATGGECSGGFGEYGGLVGGQVDYAVGDDEVAGGVRNGELFDVAVEESDVVESGGGAESVGLGQLGVGHVDAGDLAGGTDQCGRGEGVGARARAEIEHAVAGLWCGEVEEVPDAGE